MDRTTLWRLFAETEGLLYREDQQIARQRGMVRMLKRAGQDVAAANLQLRRLETRQARHIADRNRLFKELGESSRN